MHEIVQRLLTLVFWSPRRLMVIIAALVVVAWLLGALANGCAPSSSRGDHPPASSSRPSATAEPSASPTTKDSTGGDDAVAGTRVRALMARTATDFVAAWARPHLSRPQWLSGLETSADPAFLTTLKSVDPAEVPATRVTGEAATQAASATGGRIIVPTDAGTVGVEITHDGHRYRVTSLTPPDREGEHR